MYVFFVLDQKSDTHKVDVPSQVPRDRIVSISTHLLVALSTIFRPPLIYR